MKVKSESEVAQACPTLCDPMDCSLPGSSVHGIFQSRVLEWSAFAFSELKWWANAKCSKVNHLKGLQVQRNSIWQLKITAYQNKSHLQDKSSVICFQHFIHAVLIVFIFFTFELIIRLWMSAAAAAKSLQSCPTLCDPIDGSPSGSAVPGILQARTLEWVAISSSNAWKWKWSRSVVSSCSDPMDCSPPVSSVRGIFQAKVLEWGATAFSKWMSNCS